MGLGRKEERREEIHNTKQKGEAQGCLGADRPGFLKGGMLS